jgi:ABC-type Mn2+/Zn2+ transport system ATPase subunit
MQLLEEFRKTDHLIRHHHPHEAGAPILRAADLGVRYESGPALEGVSFELEVGERLAVVGPNGAGKSTLFKVIAGVMTPSDGKVHVYGHEPGGHICIAYLPQRSQVDWNFPVSVADVVMMGRVGKLKLFRHPRARDWEIVRNALDVVGMQDLAGRQIRELSGGQQQRMFIARALAQEAELMLMDEPLTGLDLNSQEGIFRILEDLRQSRVTVLVALHDLQMAADRFDRVMLLNVHLVSLGTPGEVFTSDNLMDAYGGHLRLIQTDDGVLALEDTCCGGGEEG